MKKKKMPTEGFVDKLESIIFIKHLKSHCKDYYKSLSKNCSKTTDKYEYLHSHYHFLKEK